MIRAPGAPILLSSSHRIPPPSHSPNFSLKASSGCLRVSGLPVLGWMQPRIFFFFFLVKQRQKLALNSQSHRTDKAKSSLQPPPLLLPLPHPLSPPPSPAFCGFGQLKNCNPDAFFFFFVRASLYCVVLTGFPTGYICSPVSWEVCVCAPGAHSGLVVWAHPIDHIAFWVFAVIRFSNRRRLF